MLQNALTRLDAMDVMMTVSQMTREGHHGQVGGRAPATLAVNRGLFLGAPRPVKGIDGSVRRGRR